MDTPPRYSVLLEKVIPRGECETEAVDMGMGGGGWGRYGCNF